MYQWNASTEAWVQLGQTIDGEAAGDQFGYAVSISSNGSRIAASAPTNNGNGSDAGHTRVYEWNNTTSTWDQLGSDIDGMAADDNSGYATALSGSGQVLAVGAPFNDDNGTSSGHVRVFTWNSGTSSWVQRGATLTGSASREWFGYSVDVTSSNVVVGAPRYDDGSEEDAGCVRIYNWNTGTSSWDQRPGDIIGLGEFDNLGAGVAANADASLIIAGAPVNDDKPDSTGYAQVYRWKYNGSSFSYEQYGSTLYGEGPNDRFGRSVSMASEDRIIAVGASANSDAYNLAGHVRVYTWNSTDNDWEQWHNDFDGEAAGDIAGVAALSGWGNNLAIGAPFHDNGGSDMGQVRVFKLDSTASSGSPTCATGLVTWDGGGSDERFFTKENWVGDLCPCAGADLLFNGTGTNTQHCILDSSLTLGTITLTNAYKGRFRVEKSGVVLTADTLQTTGPQIVLNPETGTSVIGVVTVSNNAMFNCASNAGVRITTFNLGLAGFCGFRSRSTVHIGNLNMDEYAQFKGPQNGFVHLTGNIQKAKRNTFDPTSSTFVFNGTAAQTFHFSTGSGAAGSNGACSFWNVELNKTNTASSASDNLSGTDNTDTLVVLNRLTTRSGDWTGGASMNILDTLNMIGTGNDGHSGTFRMAGTNTADVICNSGTTNPSGSWTLAIEMQNPNRLVQVWKGTASSINLGSGNVQINTGKLRFDENVDASIPRPITVTSTGQLVAPSTKRLSIGSHWNMADRNAFEPRTGEVYINGSGNSNWNHNNRRVFFYNLTIDAPSQTHSWSTSSNDTLWVLNNLHMADGSPRSAVVVFEGNISSGASADPRMDEFVASGSNNQSITLGAAAQLEGDNLMINKSGGEVGLGAEMQLTRLTLKNGHIKPGSYALTMTASNAGGNGIIGGNSNSFIDGKLNINTGSSWAATKFKVPVGKGSKYRPITLHNSSDSNTWAIEFINADPNALGSSPALNGGIYDLTTDGYWNAFRTKGGKGNFSDAAYFEISDAGKGSWSTSDLTVANFVSGSNAWNNLGGTFTSAAVISTVNTLRNNADFVLTLANDNPCPTCPPDRVAEGDRLSLNELETSAAAGNGQAGNTNGKVQFGIYPNPVNATLHIALSGADKGSITLSDMSGKVLGIYSAETRSIDMSLYAAGVYFATFSNGLQSITQRVIRN